MVKKKTAKSSKRSAKNVRKTKNSSKRLSKNIIKKSKIEETIKQPKTTPYTLEEVSRKLQETQKKDGPKKQLFKFRKKQRKKKDRKKSKAKKEALKLDKARPIDESGKIISKKSPKKSKKQNPLIILMFSLIFLVAIIIPFIFRNIIVYIISGVILLSLIILLIIKRPKKIKVEEIKQVEKKIEVTPTYTTEFDKFYNYIRKNKKATISKMSKVFKMPKKQVEEWATILEERELIRIHYPLFGEPELQYPE